MNDEIRHVSRTVVFPLPPCGDYLPLLAIQDGRMENMIEQASDTCGQTDVLGYLMGALYPNCCWSDRRPR